MIPTDEPVIQIEAASPAIREVHRWVEAQGFARLERWPWPGGLRSCYDDPAIWARFVTGRSNCWQASALSRAYDAWLRSAAPQLWLLSELFRCCRPVPVGEVRRRIPAEALARWSRAGLWHERDGQVSSRVRATPWRGRIFWHDAPPSFRPGFVFLGADSVTFARRLQRWMAQQRPRRFTRALDLCTGTGLHALMLRDVADHVVGADLNPRAIAYARLNASLHGTEAVSFMRSDLFADVPPGPYEVIACNGPLLFLPEALRPSCLDGDAGALGIELVLRIVDGLSGRLAPGGVAILHANSPWIDGSDVLRERLQARLHGGPWQVTMTPTHEFYDPAFAAWHRLHRIRRFVTYHIILEARGPFRWRRPSLAPWRKAACAVRIAGVRASRAPRHQRMSHA